MQLAWSDSWFLELVFPLSCSFTSTAPHPSLQNQACSGGDWSQAEPDPEHPQEQSLAFRLGFSPHLLSATPAAAAGPMYLSFFFFSCAPNTLIKQHKAPAELAAPGRQRADPRAFGSGAAGFLLRKQLPMSRVLWVSLSLPRANGTRDGAGTAVLGHFWFLFPPPVRLSLCNQTDSNQSSISLKLSPRIHSSRKRDIKHESKCPLERQASCCSGIMWLLLRSL